MNHLVRAIIIMYFQLYLFLNFLYFNVHIDNNCLACLMKAIQPVCDWLNLGVFLGVDIAVLKIIEKDQRGLVEDCKREMLVKWLMSSEEPRTKQQLLIALWDIKHSQHEL